MIYNLENDVIRVAVREQGAELRALTEKTDDTEYLWDGNPEWWKYSSPVLFPIVGKLADGKYRVNGEEYSLPSHGLGRISKFTLIDKNDASILFALDYNEDTLKNYPYRFRLEIGYTLENNSVRVKWRVINKDDKDIFFSIGAHPALLCPIVKGEDITDCYLEFSQEENVKKFAVTPDAFLKKEYVDGFKGRTQDLSWEFFSKGTWIFDKLGSDRVTIRSRKSKKSIAVEAPGFPFWAFWSPEKGGAPFICIEPWYGHADFENYDGEFSAREGTQRLAPDAIFETEYRLIIGE